MVEGNKAPRGGTCGGYLRGVPGKGVGGRGSRINQPLGAVSYRAIKSELKYQFIAGDFICALGALRRGTVQKKTKKKPKQIYIYTYSTYNMYNWLGLELLVNVVAC